MNKQFIENRIISKFQTKTNFAEKLGVKLGSVTDWFQRGVIPAARIAEVFDLLDINSEEEVESALNIPQIGLCYRVGKTDVSEREIDLVVQRNTKNFSKVFFGLKSEEKVTLDLQEIRTQIGTNRNAEEVASIIRGYLDLTDRSPLNLDSINYILEKYGVNVYFIPFSAFQFNSINKNPLALTAHKGNKHLILCDSARTWDEAFFDLTHELVHVFTGLLGVPRDNEVEDFIDLVAEELIYPRLFLEREFPFLLNKGRLTEKLFLEHNFKRLVTSSVFMAPRGIAKRLHTLGYFPDPKRNDVYEWMHDVEHKEYLEYYGSSVSTSGKMDFDFTDAYAFERFIDETVKPNPSKYPLFYELVRSLCEGRLTTRAFGEIFNLDSGEVDELRLKWTKEFFSDELRK